MKDIRTKTMAFLFSAVLSATVLTACGNRDTQTTAVQATRVQTQSASKGTLEITGTYIGTVSPHNSVDVTPLVSGTVLEVNVRVGDKVKAGDVLCRFDDKAADLQLKSAENAVESAKAGKEAAQDQIDSARKQADASITSMEGQVKTLKAQKKAAEEQLAQLEAGLEQMKAAQEAGEAAYEASKEVYDAATRLYIQYKVFLDKYPDCMSTAGLTQASIPKLSSPSPVFSGIGSTDDEEHSLPEPDEEEEEKQRTAAELLNDLGEIPLTVEYLSETGRNSLKDRMEQAKQTSTSSGSGYSQAVSTIGTLKTNIKQLKSQIDALEDNIDAAEEAADSSGSTKAYDAQIKAAQTGVESAQYQKDLYTVTSPIDGIVETVNVTENEISAQGYPAFTISDKEVMEVSFYVPEEVRDYLRTGDEVMVETASGETAGKVSLIATAVDPQKGLFKIDARINQNDEKAKTLLSNTSVSLSLVTNSIKNRILIPFDAVYYDNDQAYVFVAEDNHAVRRDVETGPYNNDLIAILDGLQEGEEVITSWGAGLKDGALIQVMEGD